jgi:hypothetical protein
MSLPFRILQNTTSSRDWYPKGVLVRMSVRNVVFAADEDTTGTVRTTRNLEQLGGTPSHGLGPFADDVIETQVKLIKDQKFLHLFESLATWVLVYFGIVHFQGSKDGILIAHVESYTVKDQGLRLVGL